MMSTLGFSESDVQPLRRQFAREQMSTFGQRSDQDLATVQKLAALPEEERAKTARALGAADPNQADTDLTAVKAAEEYKENLKSGAGVRLASNAAAVIGFAVLATTGPFGAVVGLAAGAATAIVGGVIASHMDEKAENLARVRMAVPSSAYSAINPGQLDTDFAGQSLRGGLDQQFAQKYIAAKTAQSGEDLTQMIEQPSANTPRMTMRRAPPSFTP